MPQYQVGEFLFDTSSGRLSRKDQGESSLAPQPARLLELLIARYPEAVSREEIRRILWSEVTIEFEQGLHHCVRQVRQALGDSATDPSYVRTIHRKGYQLIAQVSRVHSAGNAQAPEHDSAEPSALRARLDCLLKPTLYWTIAAAVVVGIVIAIGRFTSWFDEPVRIAVMSFESGDVTNSIAEDLVFGLTDHPDHIMEIIGPTSTGRFENPQTDLAQLAAELQIDFILNGRFTDANPQGQLLAEIIRTSDGAHVWARYFDTTDAAVAQSITEGLFQYLSENPPDEDD